MIWMRTYADSGVDRDLRSATKKSLDGIKSTFGLSKHGKTIETPFNTLYPIGNGSFQVKTSDGVGTKVLLAQLAGRHDTIGIDAIAMVANDCIRCGAEPIALTDMIDIKKSEPKIIREIVRGLNRGARDAGCPLVGGEIADVPELLNSLYQINCDCVGEVSKGRIITGKGIKPGDIVIGMRSSGIHSNGDSLLRKTLFREWGGIYDAFEVPDGLDRELIREALEPTRIYVKAFLKAAKEIDVLGAVHITGDAYLKFRKLSNHGFEFDNFKPQPIFGLMKGHVPIEEMFKTFNMGWGFAVVIGKEDAEDALQLLKSSEVLGKVVKRGITIKYEGSRINIG
jgi:phosphoribosylformylglycinamidine cyclo-ligase